MVGCLEKKSTEVSADCSFVIVDLSIYSFNSIKKSCYKFTSRCSMRISKVTDGQIKISFSFPANTNNQTKEKTVNDFYNEMLDQDLRETVFKETEVVRNLILAQAFSKTSLIE